MNLLKRKNRTPLYKAVELNKALYRADLIGVVRVTEAGPTLMLDLSDLDFLEKIVPQIDASYIFNDAPNTIRQYGGIHIFKIDEHKEENDFAKMLANENLTSCYIMPYQKDGNIIAYLIMGYIFKNFYYMKPEDFAKIMEEFNGLDIV